MTDLFDNAIVSIKLGVEDYRSDESDRVLSAVRNFYAGVLLLGKECLVAAAPPGSPAMDVLARRFEPALEDGDLIYLPIGSSTIDVSDLKARFKRFHLDWPGGDLNRLQDVRNRIEHFHADDRPEQIREAIASCFETVAGFFTILGRVPPKELGGAWETMMRVEALVRAEVEACLASYKELPWADRVAIDPECDACGSSLLMQKDPSNTDPSEIFLECRSCGAEFKEKEAILMLIRGSYVSESDANAFDGEQGPVYDCLDCGGVYVAAGNLSECLSCGTTIPDACARCDEPLTPNSRDIDDSELCSYCSHMMRKDD